MQILELWMWVYVAIVTHLLGGIVVIIVWEEEVEFHNAHDLPWHISGCLLIFLLPQDL